MRYGSVCSGIEAATMAWHPLGWKPAFFSEIEKFPSAVLTHHYPDVPNHGDMTKYEEWPDDAIDLLVGGTPCQSFSVAGLRQGLADPRGNLMLTYLAIARRYQPRWLVWENVPGVLSSNQGRDFGTFIRGLEECGYHAAWRVLDAQYVRVDGYRRAVPQRRRRVFVVGYLGDWRRAAAVLFEREGLQGHPAPSRQAGQGFTTDVVSSLTASGRGVERTGETCGQDPVVAVTFDRQSSGEYGEEPVASTVSARDFKGPSDLVAFEANMSMQEPDMSGVHPTITRRTHAAVAFQSSQSGVRLDEVHATLDANNGSRRHNGVAAFTVSAPASGFAWEKPYASAVMATPPSDTANTQTGVRIGLTVRRLTPVECERLQGFPDNFTAVPYRGKPASDGPRYKALGNSMACNVMRWIGQRIDKVDRAILASREAA